MKRRIQVAWKLLRSPQTRREAWPWLLGRPVLADWEADLLLAPSRGSGARQGRQG